MTCAPVPQDIEAGVGRIVILPMHGGRPLGARGAVQADVTLEGSRPEDKRRLFRPFQDGRIELPDLDTDVYRNIRLTIDLNQDNELGMAGDHVAVASGPWALHRDGDVLERRVDTAQIMRLVKPDDSRLGPSPQDGTSLPAFHSPLALSWRPVPGATSYRVALWRRRFRFRDLLSETDTTDSSVNVDLAPTIPGEVYILRLEAFGSTGLVGRLQTKGTAVPEDSHAFRIARADEPVVAPPPPQPEARHDRGSARLQIVPLLGGEPYALPPRTWVRTVLFGDHNVSVGDERPVGGIASFVGLPAGTYSPMLTVFGERDAALRRPVCRRQGGTAEEIRLVEGETTRIEAPMHCELELLQPAVPAQERSNRVEPPEIASPVTFEWLPAPRVVRYGYEVHRLDANLTEIAKGETDQPRLMVALEPSILKEKYRLVVTALGPRERVGGLDFLFRIRGGQPAPGRARMLLVPTFDGQPLDASLDMPVTATLMRAPTGSPLEVPCRLANGAVELPDVETGVYHVHLSLDVPDMPPLSSAGMTRPVALLEGGRSVHHEIAMYAPLEFTTPPPSSQLHGAARPILRSPVTIAWKPVHGAIRYLVDLDDAMAVDDDVEPQVRTFEVTTPSWTAPLPPTGREQYYTVFVRAQGTRTTVGKWLSHFGVEGDERPNR